MNSDRIKFIDAWAKHVKTNPLWRLEHKEFIDAQTNNANQFYKRLIHQKNGLEKFKRVTGASDKFTKEFLDLN